MFQSLKLCENCKIDGYSHFNSESKESSTHSTPTPVANHSSSSTPTVTATQQPVAVPKPVATYPVNIDPQLIAEFKVSTKKTTLMKKELFNLNRKNGLQII